MKTSFPSPIERVVASALLRLSSSDDCPFTFYQEDDGIVAETSAPPIAKMTIVKKKKTERDFERNDSVSSRRFKIVSIKVVKKRRSKTEVFSKSLPERKMTSSENTASSSSSSCVTAMSSCESIRRKRREEEEEREHLRVRQKKMKAGSAPNMQRRAEAIVRILESGRSYSEIEIRKIFGDSPTTSKALRLFEKGSITILDKSSDRKEIGTTLDTHASLAVDAGTSEEIRRRRASGSLYLHA